MTMILQKRDFVPITLLVFFRAISVFYMIISDCDEVFNYWEPLNLLVRNFGKQTWEYSPEYSIRSWAYLLPYYAILMPLVKFGSNIPSWVLFYVVRGALGLFVLIGEIKLYSTLKQRTSFRLAFLFAFFSSVSTGMTHGSIALLPSSFGLGCILYALSSTIHFFYTKEIAYSWGAIFWYSLSGILGWPFTLALAIPLILYSIGVYRASYSAVLKFIVGCAIISGTLLASVISIDSWFYKKFSIVPLNIFLYNVLFADEESGPNIFGTEPFSYYIMNLLLNFNIIFIFAIVGLFGSWILCFVNTQLSLKAKQRDSKFKLVTDLPVTFLVLTLSPLLLWLSIFGAQPHKEERFMYPVYPLLNFSAAIFVSLMSDSVELLLGSQWLVTAMNSAITSLVFIVSTLRTILLIKNYSAPLKVYKYLPQTATGNVCTGREWYRYPSSFFLSDNLRMRFVKSGFNGLLPGDFKEENLLDSISSYPEGMNNKNKFDPGKVSDLSVCDYFVDIDEDVDLEAGETKIYDDPDWSVVVCEKFINTDKSHGIGRVIYVPELLQEALKTKLSYHKYCLLEKSLL